MKGLFLSITRATIANMCSKTSFLHIAICALKRHSCISEPFQLELNSTRLG